MAYRVVWSARAIADVDANAANIASKPIERYSGGKYESIALGELVDIPSEAEIDGGGCSGSGRGNGLCGFDFAQGRLMKLCPSAVLSPSSAVESHPFAKSAKGWGTRRWFRDRHFEPEGLGVVESASRRHRENAFLGLSRYTPVWGLSTALPFAKRTATSLKMTDVEKRRGKGGGQGCPSQTFAGPVVVFFS
jgi:hypothetical protein